VLLRGRWFALGPHGPVIPAVLAQDQGSGRLLAGGFEGDLGVNHAVEEPSFALGVDLILPLSVSCAKSRFLRG